jgi:DNA-binding transcriptional regulator YiaG
MEPLIDNAAEVQRVVRELRQHGVTPQVIAERLDVNVRTVYHWNKGDTGPRRPALMAGLLAMLDEVRHAA